VLLAVAAFLAVEIALLRQMLDHQPLYLIFSVLGLCVAATALYGHVFISWSSRLLVNAVAGAEEGPRERPRFGPAESLERQGAHEDALQEYLVLARIFPHDPEIYGRMARCHLAAGRAEEAVKWWRRALKHAAGAGEALGYAQRICGVFVEQLAAPAEAHATLAAFVARFPHGPDSDAAREHMRRLAEPVSAAIPLAPGLTALDEAPLEEDAVELELPVARPVIGLAAMDEAVPEPEAPDDPETSPASPAAPRLSLRPMDDEPLDEEPADGAAPDGR
jgi:tetratricopeptide (TPR) repeat protein